MAVQTMVRVLAIQTVITSQCRRATGCCINFASEFVIHSILMDKYLNEL